MSMKMILDTAKASIIAGNYPKVVLAGNKKTGVSIMDNVPQLTCYGACPIRDKCYDVRILKLRPNVLKSRALRHYLIALAPEVYIRKAIGEIMAGGYSQVRIYAGGDFTPSHVPILSAIMAALPGVRFYMISKTIRTHILHALTLLTFPNFFLNISECADFYFDSVWDDLRDHARVNTVYTLLVEDKDYDRARKADIVFNVSKAKPAIKLYKAQTLPLCPCDAKDIPSEGACGSCRLCSVKGGVRFNLQGAN